MLTVHYNPLDNKKGIYTYRLDSDKEDYLVDLFNDVLYPECSDDTEDAINYTHDNSVVIYVKLKGEICISSDLVVIFDFIHEMQHYESGFDGYDDAWCIVTEFKTKYAAFEFALNMLKSNSETDYNLN